MKRLLFLPLAALLCFGCSKENIQGDNDLDMTTQNSSSDVIDLVYSGPGSRDPAQPMDLSWLEYTGTDGQLHFHQFSNWESSLRVQIPRNSSVTIRLAAGIQAPQPNDEIRWALLTNAGVFMEGSGVNPITETPFSLTPPEDPNVEQFDIMFACEVVHHEWQ